MVPETLCFAAVVALLAVVVWVCSKLKGTPPPLIAEEYIPRGTLVSKVGGDYGGVYRVRRAEACEDQVDGFAFAANHLQYKRTLQDLAYRRFIGLPTPCQEDPTNEP